MRGENTKQRKYPRQDLEIPRGKILWAVFRHSDSCFSIKSKSKDNYFSEFLKVIHIAIYKLENHKLNSENNSNIKHENTIWLSPNFSSSFSEIFSSFA